MSNYDDYIATENYMMADNDNGCNGYSSWDAWNVSLWLHNDEHRYADLMWAIRRSFLPQTCARALWEILDTHTPDGARYTIDNILEAIEDDHAEYWAEA